MLIDKVKKICHRLAAEGWRDLFLQHGLDILAEDLKAELLKELPNINRKLKGFEDFSFEGIRGIEPGQPARSLFYHALASPNVVVGVNGLELTTFPTLAEIDAVENYVFGIEPPSILELRSRANGGDLALVVFASEYRPAPETIHKKHADLCFSRTGVARVGTLEPLYDAKNRGFLPFVEGEDFAFRVLPARYSAYIALKRHGNKEEFGPMRFRDKDEEREFWVPLHKLFEGEECIRDYNLNVSLEAHHVNEKLRRIHLALRKKYDTGFTLSQINESPFIFTEGIADWAASELDYGENVIVPTPHSKLVEKAWYENKILSFKVPENNDTIESSLRIPDTNGARTAPEYVHVRHSISTDGDIKNLNDLPNVTKIVIDGGYEAVHYIDFTGDGYIKINCTELDSEFPGRHAAYSLVTAPDFFPNCDQRELMDWWEQQVPNSTREGIWRISPETLSDVRYAANIELKDANFHVDDVTITAIVSIPYKTPAQLTVLNVSEATRQSYLPDAAAGVFAPGWDVSYDRNKEGKEFLAAYGLGSPFPEDSKLCAALSTFWPAVAPDAARTFEPNNIWPTVSPLTDEEIGKTGHLPWDGVYGPKSRIVNGKECIEYTKIEYADYVENAVNNKFSLSLTGQVDVKEYQERILSMFRVYKAMNINKDEKGLWSVFSFRKVTLPNKEFKEAQEQTGISEPMDNVYRFEIYKHGKKVPERENHRKILVEIDEKATLFVSGVNVFLQNTDMKWTYKQC